MLGYLITYKTKSRSDIVKINHYLFGKIVNVNKKKYFYPGLLDNIMFMKINNGCYFITIKMNDNEDKFVVYNVDLNIDNSQLYNARTKWLKHVKQKQLQVKNLNV